MTNEDLEERFNLLEGIKELEASVPTSKIEDLQEHLGLLEKIKALQDEIQWVKIEDLEERVRLLYEINRESEVLTDATVAS